MTCFLCGGMITVCASCRATCDLPVCQCCRDADVAPRHGETITLPKLADPVLLADW